MMHEAEVSMEPHIGADAKYVVWSRCEICCRPSDRLNFQDAARDHYSVRERVSVSVLSATERLAWVG